MRLRSPPECRGCECRAYGFGRRNARARRSPEHRSARARLRTTSVVNHLVVELAPKRKPAKSAPAERRQLVGLLRHRSAFTSSPTRMNRVHTSKRATTATLSSHATTRGRTRRDRFAHWDSRGLSRPEVRTQQARFYPRLQADPLMAFTLSRVSSQTRCRARTASPLLGLTTLKAEAPSTAN